MKFTANSKDLLRAIKFAESAAAKKSTLPSLNSILVRAGSDGLTLTGSNLDIYITTKCAANVTVDGALCLPVVKFVSFVANTPDADISAELKENRLLLTSGSAKASLSFLEAQQFPNVPNVEGETITLPASVLHSKLSKISHAISDDSEGRPAIVGALFEFANHALNFVATDGRRLATTSVECEGEGKYNVPLGLVAALTSTLDSQEGDCVFAVKESHAKFSTSELEIVGRLSELSYPNWRHVIPKNQKSVSANAEAFRSVVKRAAVFATNKASSVKLYFDKNKIKVTAGDGDNNFEDVIAAKAFKAEIAFQPAYLLDALNSIDSENAEMQIEDSLTPLLITEADHLELLMPMRMA